MQVLLQAVAVTYHAVTIHRYGGTPGHRAVHANIVNHCTGERLSIGRSTARALLGILDILFVPFCINGAMVLTRPDRRHIYDLIAGTVAVSQPETAARNASETASGRAKVLDSVQLVPTAAYGEKRQATALACSLISGISLRSHVVSRLRYVEKTNLTSSPSTLWTKCLISS